MSAPGAVRITANEHTMQYFRNRITVKNSYHKDCLYILVGD